MSVIYIFFLRERQQRVIFCFFFFFNKVEIIIYVDGVYSEEEKIYTFDTRWQAHEPCSSMGLALWADGLS